MFEMFFIVYTPCIMLYVFIVSMSVHDICRLQCFYVFTKRMSLINVFYVCTQHMSAMTKKRNNTGGCSFFSKVKRVFIKKKPQDETYDADSDLIR